MRSAFVKESLAASRGELVRVRQLHPMRRRMNHWRPRRARLASYFLATSSARRIHRSVFIAPYPATARKSWEEFPAARALQLWGEMVPASAADESARACRRAGWARSALPDLRKAGASHRECGGQRTAAVRCCSPEEP